MPSQIISANSDLGLNKDCYKGFLFSVLFIAAFNWMWLDAYFPVTEGWFSAYAHRWIEGYLPYRDTRLFLPPLYTWQISIWERLFGPALWGLRLLGLISVTALAAVLYSLLRKFTSSFGAAIGAALSVICFESFNVFIPYDYHTFDTLYAVISVFFVVKSFESRVPGRVAGRELIFLLLSGFFAACCALVKHSMGALLLLTVFVIYLAGCRGEKIRQSLLRLLLLGLGAALPVAVFVFWLFAYSSPAGFYQDVVLGVGAKGSLASILFGFIGLQFTPRFIFQIMIAAAIFFYLDRLAAPVRRETPPAGWLALAGAGVFVVGHHFVPYMELPRWFSSLHLHASGFVVPLAIAATVFSAIKGIPALGKPLTGQRFALLAVAALSCCLMYSTALSTLISAPGAFLGVGLAVSSVWNKVSRIPRLGALFLSIMFLYADGSVGAKYARPYYWWNISAPGVRSGLTEFAPAILKGISTAPENKTAIEGTARIIIENTKPGDFIFAYPSIPIFYLLSDRWPPTKSLQHWYDTVDDAGVMEDLARLKAHPPRVIALLDLPPDAAVAHEKLFRAGKFSAQREMSGWIAAQIDAKVYKAAADFSLGGQTRLKVFKRAD